MNSNNQPQIGHIGRQLIEQVKTGSNEADVMSNIYDLEGNNREWTAQAYANSYRAIEGGCFADAKYGSFYPSSSRAILNPTNAIGSFTSRASLYL